MIARIWHGWTTAGNADKYEAVLKGKVLPGLHRIRGYRAAHVLRREAGNEVEFAVMTLWDSMEAVNAFAGPEGRAVITQEAEKLLAHYDKDAVHYTATFVE